jgi:hypothetical protein
MDDIQNAQGIADVLSEMLNAIDLSHPEVPFGFRCLLAKFLLFNLFAMHGVNYVLVPVFFLYTLT